MYFTRPNDTVELRHQGEKSTKIAEAVAKAAPGKYEPGTTSAEWLVRRIRAKRIAHYNVCCVSNCESLRGCGARCG